ncbi:hypothetical protein H6F86_03935 [Phormidium sp. FACHB-592]|uniref:Uncharacterized protein n=1 Tax=Stenomitos frigidus AS-A4 TaxID=2933935 RepID=A0ABV0KQW9_9CYAN|nr:hypothetical protein [Phormidium sp. FACHB-592]MBD2073050.1 hypothetical protein [Phormidium sp. FACHB-592]
MLVLNEAQALVVESLLTKMLINEPYSVNELEEAIAWFQREGDRFSCPFEQVWSKNLAQEIVRALRNQSSSPDATPTA